MKGRIKNWVRLSDTVWEHSRGYGCVIERAPIPENYSWLVLIKKKDSLILKYGFFSLPQAKNAVNQILLEFNEKEKQKYIKFE